MDKQALDFYLKNHPWKEQPRKGPKDPTYLMTGPVRIRWADLATPRQARLADGKTVDPSKPAKFGATLLIPGETDISVPVGAYNRMMGERFGPDFRQTLVRVVQMPNGQSVTASSITGGFKPQADMFGKKDQDGKPKYEGFAETGWFISANNTKQPPIIGATKDPITGKFLELDPASALVYEGMWVIAYLRCYTRPKQGLENPGLSFNLESLQKIADDTKFARKGNATAAFGEVQAFGGTVNGTGAPAQTPVMPAGF